uniref:G-protein coupled receptors family 3 profile domain-containing protein n=1 Tax=Varanus komodoensis TaxID=61221 RepID=A0A8D2LZ41_VARKO
TEYVRLINCRKQTLSHFCEQLKKVYPSNEIFLSSKCNPLSSAVSKAYQHIMALAFAVKEINANPQLLSNFTLGFHIYDSYDNARRTYQATMLFTSALQRLIPNYICNVQHGLVAIIGGPDSEISLHAATLLDVYKIPQLTYGPAPMMNDKTPGLPFYQVFPKEVLQNAGILSLLLHFKWTWIGLLVMDSDRAERFVQTVSPLFSENGICFAFIARIPKFSFYYKILEMLQMGIQIYEEVMGSTAKVLVVYGNSYSILLLRWFTYISGLEGEINKPKGKVLIMTAQMELVSFWYQRNWDAEMFNGAIAFIFHSHNPAGFKDFLVQRNPLSTKGDGFIKDFWQNAFGCIFPNSSFARQGDVDVCTGEEDLDSLPAPFFEMSMTGYSYSIYNAVYAVAHALHTLRSTRLKYRAKANGWRWKLQKHTLWQETRPVSVCTESCHPGSSKKVKEGEPFCCYTCIPCPDGRISQQEVFMKNHDTPIVKANNRDLTYTLLISLLLCFLCALLFIGRPTKVTCVLRQTAFGIIFSVAVSCVLAKTITVVLAFMATKPGSQMRRCVGRRLANSIILSCSLVQVAICMLWLSSSPPYPDVDMHSVGGQIVLECNEGSVVMFYSVLGYMGFLSLLCFVVAFHARQLPDSFNEAKFITFSMVVFCGVWLSFVPGYVSSKGKYIVAVEIFSILGSSSGLLACIFSPKCYIILLRPELNNREQLIRRTK